MKRRFYVAMIIAVLLIIASVVLVKQANHNDVTLDATQKEMLEQTDMDGEPLDDMELDKFTIGMGKQLFQSYMNSHDMHYKVGSQDYVNLLNEVSIDKSTTLDGPRFQVIDAYASVYQAELQEHMPTFFRFKLKKATLAKTIKQIRKENTGDDLSEKG